MPRDRWRATLLLVLLLAVPLAGCLDGAPGDGPGEDGEDDQPPPEDTAQCEKAALPNRQDGAQGKLLFMACQGTTPGRQRGELDCPRPQEAELQVATNLTAGQIRVAVHDATGTELANTTVQDTGGEPRTLPMRTSGAEAGTWTGTVHRDDAFRGDYRFELWCPS